MELLIHNYSICGLAITEGQSFDQAVGIAVQAFSKHKNISSRELASFIEQGEANVSKIKAGQTSLTMTNLLKICAIFQISPVTFMDLACDIYTYPNNPESKWVKK